MIALVRNELYKMLMKKKMILIVVLLFVFIALFVYGEQYVYVRATERFAAMGEGFDWRVLAEQQINKMKGRLDSPYIPESGLKAIGVQISQLEYYLENNINPITPSAARFTVDFADQSLVLFIPLLILVLGADLVSGNSPKARLRCF